MLGICVWPVCTVTSVLSVDQAKFYHELIQTGLCMMMSLNTHLLSLCPIWSDMTCVQYGQTWLVSSMVRHDLCPVWSDMTCVQYGQTWLVSSMVRHDTGQHNWTVHWGLVVSFCGHPHYCYWLYYLPAWFQSHHWIFVSYSKEITESVPLIKMDFWTVVALSHIHHFNISLFDQLAAWNRQNFVLFCFTASSMDVVDDSEMRKHLNTVVLRIWLGSITVEHCLGLKCFVSCFKCSVYCQLFCHYHCSMCTDEFSILTTAEQTKVFSCYNYFIQWILNK